MNQPSSEMSVTVNSILEIKIVSDIGCCGVFFLLVTTYFNSMEKTDESTEFKSESPILVIYNNYMYLSL